MCPQFHVTSHCRIRRPRYFTSQSRGRKFESDRNSDARVHKQTGNPLSPSAGDCNKRASGREKGPRVRQALLNGGAVRGRGSTHSHVYQSLRWPKHPSSSLETSLSRFFDSCTSQLFVFGGHKSPFFTSNRATLRQASCAACTRRSGHGDAEKAKDFLRR